MTIRRMIAAVAVALGLAGAFGGVTVHAPQRPLPAVAGPGIYYRG